MQGSNKEFRVTIKKEGDDEIMGINTQGVELKLKIGRWVYCKYCYKSVKPIIDDGEGLVICSKCGQGLAPLDEVIKAGSYDKWYQRKSSTFNV